jgi:hypothetical protein
MCRVNCWRWLLLRGCFAVKEACLIPEGTLDFILFLRTFVNIARFHPSLIFEGKARANPSGAPFLIIVF